MIAAAAGAARAWRHTWLVERQSRVETSLGLLDASREELARIVTRENGKTLRESRGEVNSALLEGRSHLRRASNFGGPATPRGDADAASWEQFHPVGVVGVISPWNYPLNVMCRKTMPALLMGSAVVFKPAFFTPGSRMT